MTPSDVRIDLAPKAGFCIKSTTLAPAGLKVFVNIAWDPNVPPPPEGSEDAIQRAMQGEDIDETNSSGWYVPVIVSNAREDKDKSGSPSLVFDCIYNTTVKSRTLRDPEFKVFLVELALQRIEAQTGLSLSRSIGQPNITSKGKLLPRSVQVPANMVPALTGEPSSSRKDVTPTKSSTNGNTQLIQEISTSNQGTTPFDWSWTKEDSGRLRIDVQVPGLAHALVQKSELDIEPRRLILSVPNRPTLDIDLSLSDAEIASRVGTVHASAPSAKSDPEKDKRKEEETTRVLKLKRQRDFDVDGAEAEWKVGSGSVVIYV
ncbi:hypothetical protein GALMADRAFT_100012 [Galerina marginata CBS 339.88]|uniref:PIH1 N-terminal domain-containing protein n=1 Tax=Galerina marginata (strain CBS 339.88) TaxID=685588 RepID=A0A067STB9_GALM3|nr:hypothetical protein GALMADRAFT_100012 [Galerina marginata CBS 339.88]